MDEPDYYSGGKYLAVSAEGATLPPISFSPTADSRDAIKQHLAEHAHRLAVLRSLLGIAKVSLPPSPSASPRRALDSQPWPQPRAQACDCCPILSMSPWSPNPKPKPNCHAR